MGCELYTVSSDRLHQRLKGLLDIVVVRMV